MHPKSGLLQFSHKSENGSGVKICQHDVIVIFFDVAVFLLSCLVTGASFMSILLPVLEL